MLTARDRGGNITAERTSRDFGSVHADLATDAGEPSKAISGAILRLDHHNMFLDRYFKRIELAPAARTYLCERLANGYTLANRVLTTVNLSSGDLYVSMEPQRDEVLPDFRQGGPTDFAGSSELIENAIKDFLAKAGNVVIFEDQAAKRGDAWIKRTQHFGGLSYFDDHLYQYLQSGIHSAEVVSRFLHQATSCYNCLGFFCTGIPNGALSEPTDETLNALATGVEAIVLCAFDDSGYLIWGALPAV